MPVFVSVPFVLNAHAIKNQVDKALTMLKDMNIDRYRVKVQTVLLDQGHRTDTSFLLKLH